MLTALLLSLGVATAAPEMIPPIEQLDLVGRTAPTFTAPMLEGGEFSLEAQRGKVVVLSFWASWCGPCRKELPALAALAKERSDIVVYAVNVDRDAAPARSFLRSTPFDLPVVWDNESVAMGNFNVLSMPTMFVIDAQGTVKWRKTGYSETNGLLELTTLLDGMR